MSEYKLKTGKLGEKITSAYQKIEDAVVGGYKKVEDAFVDAFLEKVEDSEAAPQADVAPESKPDKKDGE